MCCNLSTHTITFFSIFIQYFIYNLQINNMVSKYTLMPILTKGVAELIEEISK